MVSTPVQHSALNVKAVVAAFNQEKALVGAFSVIMITNLWMDLRFKIHSDIVTIVTITPAPGGADMEIHVRVNQ